MHSRKVLLIVGSIIIASLGLSYTSHLFGYEPEPLIENIPAEYQVETPNLERQTPYNCGPYNVHAIASTNPDFTVSAEELVTRIDQWKIPRLGFLPFHIRYLLKSVELKSHALNFRWLDDQDRLDILASRVANGNPIILLVKKHGYQHYITVFGYNLETDQWHIYDPMLSQAEGNQTIDTNGALPGNETLKGDELLYLWSQGGMLSFFEWYAISVNQEQ